MSTRVKVNLSLNTVNFLEHFMISFRLSFRSIMRMHFSFSCELFVVEDGGGAVS